MVGQQQTSAARGSGSFRWSDHVSVLVAAASGAFVILSLYSVSHASPETAFTVLRETGTASVLVGIAIRSLPTLLYFLVFFMVPPLARREIVIRSEWVLALAIVPLIFVTALYMLVLLIGYAIVVAWASTPRPSQEATPTKWPRIHRLLSWLSKHNPDLIVAALFLWFVAVDGMWLPPEQIATEDPSVDTYGYVLSEDDSGLLFMRDADRIVLTIEKPDIIRREFCSEDGPRSWWERPVLAALLEDPSYPKCQE